ncbi:hypothetical protein J2T13_001321 [Paenibacillus sp. DS2015]|uniref:hypothetical protein n=1 Tax=Paenibacillus sp. DS2015 TaxID=3373917 RepID=UPI003D20982C
MINGLLSVGTFVLVVGLYSSLEKTNTYIPGGGLTIIVVAILPTFLWWKLDVIGLLQKKSRGL